MTEIGLLHPRITLIVISYTHGNLRCLFITVTVRQNCISVSHCLKSIVLVLPAGIGMTMIVWALCAGEDELRCVRLFHPRFAQF